MLQIHDFGISSKSMQLDQSYTPRKHIKHSRFSCERSYKWICICEPLSLCLILKCGWMIVTRHIQRVHHFIFHLIWTALQFFPSGNCEDHQRLWNRIRSCFPRYWVSEALRGCTLYATSVPHGLQAPHGTGRRWWLNSAHKRIKTRFRESPKNFLLAKSLLREWIFISSTLAIATATKITN